MKRSNEEVHELGPRRAETRIGVDPRFARDGETHVTFHYGDILELWTVARPERAAAGVRWIITNPLNNALELQVSDMVGEQEAGEGEQKDEY